MQVVEIRHRGVELGAAMSKMRTWLDHCQAEPALFETMFLPDGEIRFLFQFPRANDASAFAKAFAGRMLTVPDEIAA